MSLLDPRVGARGAFALALLFATPCVAQTNLITNGSFDMDVLDWEPIENFMSIDFDLEDVDDSQSSGSASVAFDEIELALDTSGHVVQCVPVRPGRTYTGSASLLIPADQDRPGSAGLRVFWYQSADCTNSVGSDTSGFIGFEGAWTDLAPFDVVAPGGAFSAEVQLKVRKPVLGGTLTVLFDEVVFIPEPARSLGESVALLIVFGITIVARPRMRRAD